MLTSLSYCVTPVSDENEISLQKDHGHYYGFVYFRQVKDASLKRGYFQKVRHILVYFTLFKYIYHKIIEVHPSVSNQDTRCSLQTWFFYAYIPYYRLIFGQNSCQKIYMAKI